MTVRSITTRPHGFLFAVCIPLVMGFAVPALGQNEPAPSVSAPGTDFLDAYRQTATQRWEQAIQAIETRDRTEADPADSILFIGSSSIRRWDDIAIDMAPYRIIQRGYGGAKYSDLAVYAERLIHPHQYRGLVIFVANDVSGSPSDHTPDQVEQLVRHVVSVSHNHQPLAPVLLIEVTPSAKRWHVWGKIRDVNARLREIALSTANTCFVATAGHFLLPDGTSRTELFVADRLHLNSAGYDIWGVLIRRQLDDIFRTMMELQAAANDGVGSNN